MKETLIEVRHLTKHFQEPFSFWQKNKSLVAVDNVHCSVHSGEIVGLLGTSGCGKSTIARMLSGILKPDAGEILYEGIELQSLSSREFRPYRQKIQMIFQNPFDCLDPCMPIQKQLLEPMRIWKFGANQAKSM